MLIAQISDLHVQEQVGVKTAGVDNDDGILSAVKEINSWTPSVDLVIVTGDVAHNGRPAGYRRAAEMLERIKAPWYVLPGNHDEQETLRKIFADRDYIPQEGDFCQYTIEGYPVRIVALDSTVHEYHQGELCAQRLAWLEEQLQKERDKPTLIFMHHPPIKTGIFWMDSISLLKGAEEFSAIVQRHPQVKGIHCGHIHRSIFSSLGRVPVSVAPSTCYAVDLDLVPEGRVAFVAEPPGLHLHHWNGERVVTHGVFIGRNDQHQDLIPMMPNWEARLEVMRQGKPTPKSLSTYRK